MSSTGSTTVGRRPWRISRLAPLLWLAPVLTLLIGVVIYPMVEMVSTSLRDVSRARVVKDFTGLDNFSTLIHHPDLPAVLWQTAMWVIVVVGLTIIVSWPIALLLNADFPGRALMRYAVIVPWAASL